MSIAPRTRATLVHGLSPNEVNAYKHSKVYTRRAMSFRAKNLRKKHKFLCSTSCNIYIYILITVLCIGYEYNYTGKVVCTVKVDN